MTASTAQSVLTPITLWVGLGNPVPEYAKTRHNAGAWFIERFADVHNIRLSLEPRFNALVGRGLVEGHDVRLLLPQTFMNLSGQAVVPFMTFYKILPSQVLIAHDELDLAAGSIRLKTGGGHGGHNGLRDIVPHIGPHFHRLRVGIGHPGHKDKVTGHVLGKAPPQEQALIDEALQEALRLTPLLLQGNVAQAMSTLNAFKIV